MSTPPPTLDGAEVLYWAWSGNMPFFIMPDGEQGIPIFGLAICQYAASGSVYRFSCTKTWEVEQDSAWESDVEAALRATSTQYDNAAIMWMAYEPPARDTT
jgi:hypothetical protein